MCCPNCQAKTKVVDTGSHPHEQITIRTRQCPRCKYRFHTIETVPDDQAKASKRLRYFKGVC